MQNHKTNDDVDRVFDASSQVVEVMITGLDIVWISERIGGFRLMLLLC